MEKVLAKERAERYQSAADLVADLKPLGRQIEFSASFPSLGSDTTRILPSTDGLGEATRPPAAVTSILETARSSRALLAVITFVILAASGLGFWYYRNYSAARPIESIAVMPFVNESGNADVDYLADGIAETLINSLSRLPGLAVKGRSSVFEYKDRDVDEKTVAAKLDVQALLKGRVVQRGDDVTLYLSLEDGATGNRLWGQTYNRKFAEIVSLQSEIAGDVSPDDFPLTPDPVEQTQS